MEEKIKEWLLKGGFPLEMKLANSLINHGFEVAQSVYYQDFDTEKYRETDIIASKFEKINNIWTHITFVIECKKSTDKPWIVLKNHKLMNHLSDELPVYFTNHTSIFLKNLNENKSFKSDLFFKNSRNIGYSIQTAFNNGPDKSYEAIQSVTKACEYFSQKLNERKNTAAFYFPVICIDGNLFEGQIAENDISLKEVKKSEVLITRSFHKYGNSHILIFESSDLDKISNDLYKLGIEFFRKYKKLLAENIS
ncbi:hypothetical protein Aeqsu_2451 [Aequorivita sublithincola DSM 14238]|uniref:Uncharacterized protein n=1 Tax=Aequorivita sublithincola (strain DSM 14238 / LMG 21431 / ACAM 643 / 9-3) TaxID=746697 RepID=I3YY41_AEQSU|nr:hypothetical protein [Aequorivita sublithincola]AFL81909.1 hypothetical protein Aeqsu_2451 [Aequorivita sublithincola DSM 14238]